MSVTHPKLKRKYQVFISSTFSDLKDCREQAVLGIVKAGHLPLALEYSGPEPAGKLKVIQDAIADCQYYVIILGHRYGSIGAGQPKGQAKSYIEMELDYALEKNLKVLAFVLPQKTVQAMRNDLRRPDDVAEIENEERYWELYRRLTDGLHDPFYRPFSLPNEIFVELFGYFSKDHDDVKGYIPEPIAEEDANILRISSSNEIIRDTIQTLGQFKFVDPRLSVAKERKIALARAFYQLHGDHIAEKWKKVFIESGSTLVYVARELAPKLPRMGAGRTDGKVITNNSLAYLYLWLCSGVLCHPEPEGPPDNKYGGMFGALSDRDRIPDYKRPPLGDYDPDAVELVNAMSKSVFGEPADNGHSILLGAASGLQLSDQVKIEGGGLSPEGINECRGFHGGSYQNRLFKRCMYQARIPLFLFIHDDKIDCPVRPGVCHFLCDSEYLWDDFAEQYPLSIWVGCQSNSIRTIQAKAHQWLTAGDWLIATYGEATSTPILMATNGAFRACCDKIGVTLYEAKYRAQA